MIQKNIDHCMRLIKRDEINEMIWNVGFNGGIWLGIICCVHLVIF
jgi:hypothetical protein